MRSLVLLPLLAVACTSAPSAHPGTDRPAPAPAVGVLVMAHGGTEEWNRAVEAAVAPLAGSVPTALAFGMADRRTLSAGLDSLRQRGVGRVAVVRMFLSGESFQDQTAFYLGLTATPPETWLLMGSSASDDGGPSPIVHGMEVATHDEGLLLAPHAALVMAERAATLSLDPEREAVLVLAHGMGDDGENQRVLDAMAAVGDRLTATRPFAEVRVATLREDWPDERDAETVELRDFVRSRTEAGKRVLVLPMRLWGFGPYDDVLDGLTYVRGTGLLPHAAIADWVRVTAARVACDAGWGPTIDPCSPIAATTTR